MSVEWSSDHSPKAYFYHYIKKMMTMRLTDFYCNFFYLTFVLCEKYGELAIYQLELGRVIKITQANLIERFTIACQRISTQ